MGKREARECECNSARDVSEHGHMRPTRQRAATASAATPEYVLYPLRISAFYLTNHFLYDSTKLLDPDELDSYIAHGPLVTENLVYKIDTFVTNISVLTLKLRCELVVLLT